MNLDDLLPKKSTTTRVWSPLQDAIFDTSGPLMIRALAGTGKSTTLVELARRRGGNACFLAFNKLAATELSSKVWNQTVKTFNALGHGLVVKHRKGARLDQWKVPNRLRQVISPFDYKEYGMSLTRAIGLAKANAHYNPNQSDFLSIFRDYDLDIPFDLEEQFALVVAKVFEETLSNENSFDFDDQLYLPIREGWTFPAFDAVYVDEAQDLSPIQHLMVKQLADRGATIVAVGDPNQAIYGFRGAVASSMDDMQSLFSMDILPLSITYRCSELITREAQTLVPEIQWREGAPLGEVQTIDFPPLEEYRQGTLTICRNNAPLFKIALAHIREKKPCRVQSAFLERIEQFINGFDQKYSKDFLRMLEAWFHKESTACAQRSNWRRLSHAQDKYDTLKLLMGEFQTTNEVIDAIRRLSSSCSGPLISTIHRAKGLEADKVFILAPNLIPPNEELNLRYVGVTRARLSLNYLPEE